MNDAQPLTAAIAAEKWAVDFLHGLADSLATLPRAQKADALRLLVPSLTEVERTARLLGLR
jgi:hypothetical protein